MITILPKLTASLHLNIGWMEEETVSIWGPRPQCLFLFQGVFHGKSPLFFSEIGKVGELLEVSDKSQWLVKYDDLARYIWMFPKIGVPSNHPF